MPLTSVCVSLLCTKRRKLATAGAVVAVQEERCARPDCALTAESVEAIVEVMEREGRFSGKAPLLLAHIISDLIFLGRAATVTATELMDSIRRDIRRPLRMALRW
ncbi:hypothetical protein [Nocardia neocaledoniensis]|uniref:hypothetical protein n=1 Tax=Nocardia neocaledoniensis TaxID=236511 RepID=UPI0024567A56|nr:hypothetical protein [Nocardia neocaledoniensis]